jgi:heme exporter protein A
MSLVLETKNLSKFFGTKLVLREVNFEVAHGEVVLILGANGSGKSTLLKLLTGLIAPTSGKIERYIDMMKIGFMGHETFHYPWLTALDNLRFWGSLYNIKDEARVQKTLERVGLRSLAYEQVYGFSHGTAQKLNLARVLLIEPDLYVLDEPASGLDPQSQTHLHQEIRAIKEQGKAVLMVSHFPDRDRDLADRIFVLDKADGAFDSP